MQYNEKAFARMSGYIVLTYAAVTIIAPSVMLTNTIGLCIGLGAICAIMGPKDFFRKCKGIYDVMKSDVTSCFGLIKPKAKTAPVMTPAVTEASTLPANAAGAFQAAVKTDVAPVATAPAAGLTPKA